MKPDEEITQIKNDLMEGFLPNLVISENIRVTEADPGTVEFVRNKVIGMSLPGTVQDGTRFPQDKISRTPETKYVEATGLEFELFDKAVKIARKNQLPIEQMYLTTVGRRIAESVEGEIIGDARALATANSATQVYNAPTQSVTTKGWNQSGCDPYADVLDMLKVFDGNGTEATDMYIDYRYHRDLQKKDTHGDVIMDDIEGLGINVMSTRRLNEGEVMLMDGRDVEYLYTGTPEFNYKYELDRSYKCAAHIEGCADIMSYRDILVANVKA